MAGCVAAPAIISRVSLARVNLFSPAIINFVPGEPLKLIASAFMSAVHIWGAIALFLSIIFIAIPPRRRFAVSAMGASVCMMPLQMLLAMFAASRGVNIPWQVFIPSMLAFWALLIRGFLPLMDGLFQSIDENMQEEWRQYMLHKKLSNLPPVAPFEALPENMDIKPVLIASSAAVQASQLPPPAFDVSPVSVAADAGRDGADPEPVVTAAPQSMQEQPGTATKT